MLEQTFIRSLIFWMENKRTKQQQVDKQPGARFLKDLNRIHVKAEISLSSVGPV